MDNSKRTATRLGCAALLACAMSVTGCSIDGAGNIRWTQPWGNRGYAQPYADYDSHAAYWHGQRETMRGSGLGFQPQIDTSKFKSSAPK